MALLMREYKGHAQASAERTRRWLGWGLTACVVYLLGQVTLFLLALAQRLPSI